MCVLYDLGSYSNGCFYEFRGLGDDATCKLPASFFQQAICSYFCVVGAHRQCLLNLGFCKCGSPQPVLAKIRRGLPQPVLAKTTADSCVYAKKVLRVRDYYSARSPRRLKTMTEAHTTFLRICIVAYSAQKFGAVCATIQRVISILQSGYDIAFFDRNGSDWIRRRLPGVLWHQNTAIPTHQKSILSDAL